MTTAGCARAVLVAGAAACLCMAFVTAVCAQLQPSIAGTWEWTRKSNDCAERYQFRDNGTVSIHSGAAQTESTYRMAWTPEPSGRYKLTLTTVKREGGAGCFDTDPEAPGAERVYYVLFGGSRQTMILCNSAADADCIGPLRKSAA